MKNTIRASHNNKPRTKTAQGKKRSNAGHNATTIGHTPIDTKGRVTIAALRIGDAIGLDENQIKSLALIADFEGMTPGEFFKAALFSCMQATVEDAESRIAEFQLAGGIPTPEQKAAANLLGALPPIFRRGSNPPIDMGAAKSLLEEAVRQSEAFQVLMINTFESDNATIFRHDRRHLAAGVKSLMFHVRDELENAYDAVREASKPINS